MGEDFERATKSLSSFGSVNQGRDSESFFKSVQQAVVSRSPVKHLRRGSEMPDDISDMSIETGSPSMGTIKTRKRADSRSPPPNSGRPDFSVSLKREANLSPLGKESSSSAREPVRDGVVKVLSEDVGFSLAQEKRRTGPSEMSLRANDDQPDSELDSKIAKWLKILEMDEGQYSQTLVQLISLRGRWPKFSVSLVPPIVDELVEIHRRLFSLLSEGEHPSHADRLRQVLLFLDSARFCHVYQTYCEMLPMISSAVSDIDPSLFELSYVLDLVWKPAKRVATYMMFLTGLREVTMRDRITRCLASLTAVQTSNTSAIWEG